MTPHTTLCFARLGVRRVQTLPELLDTLSMLVATGPLRGNRLVSLSCSGGEAALIADRSRIRDLSFPAFSAEHRDRVSAALDHRVAVTNPLDYHTFIWGDAARLCDCFTAVLCDVHSAGESPAEPSQGSTADPPFDAAVLMLDLPAAGLDRSRWWPTLDAFGAACAASATPGVVVASMAENLPDEARVRAEQLGLCACGDIDTALAALEAAAAFGQSLAASAGTPPPPLLAPAHRARRASKPQSQRTDSDADAPGPEAAVLSETALSETVLTEHGAKQRLAAAGIWVPRGLLVPADEAAAAAVEIGLPVVVKATGVTHKSDVGAVAIGLSDLDEVAAAAVRLGALGDGTVTVEECVADAVVELLVSVRSEPPVGMLLTLGAGGTLVEMLDDTAVLLLPTDPADVRSALRGLRIWPLLAGHRGRPPAGTGRCHLAGLGPRHAGEHRSRHHRSRDQPSAGHPRVRSRRRRADDCRAARRYRDRTCPPEARPTMTSSTETGAETARPAVVSVVDGPVLEITLDRPKANAIDAATSRELSAVFAEFRDTPELRVAILGAAGDRFFSAGWDLNAAAAGEEFEADYGEGGFGGFGEMPGLAKPVICAVNGMAVGGGFEIVLAADLVVAAETARFWLPEAGLGIIADTASVRLPRMLPPVVANEVLYAGRRLDAAEALRWGLVNAVVAGGDLMAEARALAKRVAQSAPMSVAAISEIGRRTAHLGLPGAFELLRSGQLASYEAMLASDDAAEGPSAFTEGRPPRWANR